MKTIISLAAALLIATTVVFAGEPKISFLEKSHDFGTIKEEKGPVKYEFEFTNTGDAPLMIISAKGSCGCTVPTYSKKPIQPGKKGKVKVTFSPTGRPGEFEKMVRLKLNTKEKNATLRISGVVIPRKTEGLKGD